MNLQALNTSKDTATNDAASKNFLERYKTYAKEADLAWLKYADGYAKDGYINEHLLDFIVHVCHMHAIAHSKRKYDWFKLFLEWSMAVAAMIILSPVLIGASLAIKLTSQGPVFYKQIRVGRYGRPFYIVKFRTMFEGSDRKIPFVRNEGSGGIFKIHNDPRITPVGKFLRRWSIDELPQLWNVVKGDMALIGPRPLPCQDSATTPVDSYIRYAVRPGISGLWQVTDRGNHDGRVMFGLDAEYVKKYSLKTDAYILAKTVKVVLTGDGAY